MDPDPVGHLELTVKIVSAFVGRNQVSRSDLVDLVQNVGRTLRTLAVGAEKPKPKLVPAVPISKSVTPDFIISLEDGRRMKSLKRYLASIGMTPADYRRKWGLPPDYPLVAPNFTALRSQAAKTAGLGRRHASDQTSGPDRMAPRPLNVTSPSRCSDHDFAMLAICSRSMPS